LNLDCNNNALDRAWLTPFGATEILATPLAKNKAKKGATETWTPPLVEQAGKGVSGNLDAAEGRTSWEGWQAEFRGASKQWSLARPRLGSLA